MRVYGLAEENQMSPLKMTKGNGFQLLVWVTIPLMIQAAAKAYQRPIPSPQEVREEIIIELNTAEGFQPLDFSIVRSLHPEIRISMSPDDVGMPEITLHSIYPHHPVRNISEAFSDLTELGSSIAQIKVQAGYNRIRVSLAREGMVHTVEAGMLNFDENTLNASPPDESLPWVGDPRSGLMVHLRELLLIFKQGLPDTRKSELLRRERLRPVGILQGGPEDDSIFIVDIGENQRGLDVLELREALAFLPELDVAMAHFTASQDARSQAAKSGDIEIEILSDEGFQPLDYSVSATLAPEIRISLSDTVQGIPRVTLFSIYPHNPPRDITSAFGDLVQLRTATAQIEVPIGHNWIEVDVLAVDTTTTAAASMLSFNEDTLNASPPDEGFEWIDDPESGLPVHPNELLLIFWEDRGDVDISNLLRQERLLPIGIMQAGPESDRVFIVDTRANQQGLSVLDLRTTLTSLPELDVVIPHFAVEIGSVAAERLPSRLVDSDEPNASTPNHDRYDGASAGFDNNGTVCPVTPDPDNPCDRGTCDELDISWHHFFTDTLPALGLRDRVLTGVANPESVLAIPDSGFGNHAGATNGDINTFFTFPGEGEGARGIDVSGGGVVLSGDPLFTGPNAPLRVPQNGVEDVAALPAGHGTGVALHALGNGKRILGTGPDANLLPIRMHDAGGVVGNGLVTAARLDLSLKAAAIIPQVDVVSVSFGRSPPVGAPRNIGFCLEQRVLLGSLVFLITTNKIVVALAQNDSGNADLTWPPVFSPPRGTRHGPIPVNPCAFPPGPPTGMISIFHPLLMVVTATDIANDAEGPETFAGFSNTGSRVSVSAAGGCQNVNLNPAGNFQSISGTSFAAPKVAGLIAELIQVRDGAGRRGVAAHPNADAQMRMVETVEATADDLGTSGAIVDVEELVNDMPDPRQGNPHSPDDRFGWGRINAWKAMLAVVNKGLASEGRTAGDDGKDSIFRSLRLIPEGPKTLWYGIKIRTSVKGATVWIDGKQLADDSRQTPDPEAKPPAGKPWPKTAPIKAYKGVRTRMALDATGTALAMDKGTVPVGNEGGEYLIAFSITRDELVDSNGEYNRVLSLRKPGEGEDDAPFFNLKLELQKMRENKVPGIFFDDFIFEITPADFGDAFDDEDDQKDYPSLLVTSNGARHLNSNLEWFGRPKVANVDSVSPEVNAGREGDSRAPNPDPDPDGFTNMGITTNGIFPFPQERDRYDDGVTFFPLTYEPGKKGKLHFWICTADADNGDAGAGGRYADEPDRSLYVNAWIDWNTNGKWQETNQEHIINGLRINPAPPDNGKVKAARPGTEVKRTWVSADGNCFKYEAKFKVGKIKNGLLWARFRLDYGEDVGRNDPRNLFVSDISLRDPIHNQGAPQPVGDFRGYVQGAARFGEVQDYLIGTDFGDAKDPYKAAGRYPTLLKNKGAHHLDIYREWLGFTPRRIPRSGSLPPLVAPAVSRERDACDKVTDQDDNPNLDPNGVNCDKENADLFDDGLVLPPAFPPGGKAKIEVNIHATVSARGYEYSIDDYQTRPDNCGPLVVMIPDRIKTPPWSRGKGRYNPVNPSERLWLYVWADWNGDGTWDQDNELIIQGPVDPPDFGADGRYTLGEPFEDVNHDGVYEPGIDIWNAAEHDVGGLNFLRLSCDVDVPAEVASRFYLRARLMYGEMLVKDDLVVHHSNAKNRALDGPKGGALWGEVEDYPFPPLIKVSNPESVKPGDRIHYTLTLPGAANLETAAPAFIRDALPRSVVFDGNLTCNLGTCDYDSTTHGVTWRGDLAPRQAAIIEFDAKVSLPREGPYPPEICNTATGFDGAGEYEVDTCTRIRPVLQFSSPTYSIGEPEGFATIRVNRSGSDLEAVSVDFIARDGSARSAFDFTGVRGRLNWPQGDGSTRSFTVPIHDDNLLESAETVNLELVNPTGEACIGAPGRAVLTIVDDERDCNSNGIPDSLDITNGSLDIDGNGEPDECQQNTVPCHLTGVADGGSLTLTIHGFSASCTLTIATFPGETAETVIQNLAAAILADLCLSAQGIEAMAIGNRLDITGFALEIEDIAFRVSDSGLNSIKVPTLGFRGLLIMVLLLMGLAMYLARRRRSRHSG